MSLKYHEHQYHVWVILRKSNTKKIHDWEVWKSCFNILNDSIAREPDKMAIRTSQSFPSTSKWLSFGRMTWNEKNNIKWTSKYKTGEDKVKDLEFFDTEFWLPSWTSSEMENLPPYTFMKVESAEKGLLQEFFNESIVFANRTDKQVFDLNLIKEIYQQIDGVHLIEGNRTWGKKYTEGTFSDSLMDFSPNSLLNQENLKELEMKDKSEVFGEWKVL